MTDKPDNAALSRINELVAEEKALREQLQHGEISESEENTRLRQWQATALTLDAERTVVASRVAQLDDVDIVGAEDVPEGPGVSTAPVGAQRAEQQLAI